MTDAQTQSAPILSAQQLGEAFAMNVRILGQQVAGLTHADSLLQPPVRGNCLNWVVGHMVAHRDHILAALGEETVLDPAPRARYDHGSAPVLGEEEGVLPLATLLDAMDETQRRIAAALARATEADLAMPSPSGGSGSVGKEVHFLYWHDAYHLGQTEFLRQLAGTDDQVI